MTDDNSELLARPDGRNVAVYRLATGTTGRTVIICHPDPGSGCFDPDPEQSQSRGVTLLGIDRPGYGASDPFPAGQWPTLGAMADDLAAVIAHEGGNPVGVVGWSAGGRVALALAARHSKLVSRLVLAATPAPHDQLSWLPDAQGQLIESLRDLPPNEARSKLNDYLAAHGATANSGHSALALLGRGPVDDTAIAQPGVRERLQTMLTAAFAQGVGGLASDIISHTLQPWGFTPADIRAKTLLIYGAKDPLAGSKHGNWWQKHLPDARLEMVPNAGHFVALPMWKRVLSHLAPGVKRI